MLPDDRERLQHIANAYASVQRFISGRGREELDRDEMLRFALMRAIEIIGEAASRISESGRRDLPALPWAQMIGMRNRLVRAYFSVNHDVLWIAATREVPALATAVAAALAVP